MGVSNPGLLPVGITFVVPTAKLSGFLQQSRRRRIATPSADPVSGVASGSLLRIVPVASRSPSLSRAPSGFDSLTLNVSPSSSWASSVIGADTGKRQPNCRAGHEHV